MTEGNSDIADLSDPFRPTNLAEKFSQVYDDVWTQAYESLHNNAAIDEHTVIDFMADIIKGVDDMCRRTSEGQIAKIGHYITDDLVSPKLQTDEGTFVASTSSMKPMEDAQKERVYKLLKEFRKSFATYASRPLVEIFESCYMKKLKQERNISIDNADINKFVSKCVELIWLMKIQSPPMELLWQQKGDKSDKERFSFYTKKGGKVERCVWPAIVLHAGKKDNKELKKAIEAHNKFKDQFYKYKTFYDEHQQHSGQQENSSLKDAPKLHEKLRNEIEKLKFEKENMRKQIEELRTRLSTLAGNKMVESNPDITDLSDPFRPTKLAEDFREIYDSEWTHAFEELEIVAESESQVIDTLSRLIQEIQTFCTFSSSQQILAMEKACNEELVNPKVHIQKHNEIMRGKTPSEMNNNQRDITMRMISELRKAMGTLSVRPLVQIFYEKWVIKMKENKTLPSITTHTEKFVEKAVKVIWLMAIQDPPMALQWQEKDEPVQKEKFTFYTKKGNAVQQTVWPAVLLHKSGPLMSKGVVQPK